MPWCEFAALLAGNRQAVPLDPPFSDNAKVGGVVATNGSGPRRKAEAVVCMCPLTSRALNDDDQALEAAALDVGGALDAFKLGFYALKGDWRDAPGVQVERCRVVRIWAAEGIPAILDGESVRLKAASEVRYTPRVARILAIPKDL